MNLLQLLMVPLIVEALILPEYHDRESIPREFVFETIFSPSLANNKLYRALLEASFYRRPFPAKETTNSAVLSRGVVYHLDEGGWIMCQDYCVDCKICEKYRRNRVIPKAKWTVRRIIGSTRRPFDLQLTLSPRGDDGFHMKNTFPGSYVDHDDLITRKKGGSVKTATGDVRKTSTLIPRRHSRLEAIPSSKRGREQMRGQRPYLGGPTPPSTLFYPNEESIRDDCSMGNHLRVVLGRDQFGKKCLVHVVPAAGKLRSSSHVDTLHEAHSKRSPVLDQEDRSMYQKILRRVIDPLNIHRAAIDKFQLSSSALDDLATTSSSAKNVLPVEYEAPSSSIDRTKVAQFTSVTSNTDVDPLEEHVVAANAHHDSESESNMNIDSEDFHEQNSAAKNLFRGLSAEGSDGSGSTLILKEVAKSIVDHQSDTLQRFNLLANTAYTTTLGTDSDDSLFTRASEEGSTPGNTEYSDRREKSLRRA